MSYAYFSLYKRVINRKTYDESTITLMVDDAHEKGRLTDSEYNLLVDLIDRVYGAET